MSNTPGNNWLSEEVTSVAKKGKNTPTPKVTKVKVEGKLDSLTDLLKLRLFEYSPQSADELVKEAHQNMLTGQTLNKIQKNVNRCLTKNPSFRSEGKGLWCIRLDGLKENDAVHRILQSHGDALRFKDINQKLNEMNKPELVGEQKLVADGRFLRLKDGRWGLIHWSYVEPRSQEGLAAPKETGVTLPEGIASPAIGKDGTASTADEMINRSYKPKPVPLHQEEKWSQFKKTMEGKQVLPLAKPAPFPTESDFWEKLFPLKQGKDREDGRSPALSDRVTKEKETSPWEEVAAGAETATISLETSEQPPLHKEFSLISGGKAGPLRAPEEKDGEKNKLLNEINSLRQENKNLLSDLEKMHRRKEEMRQEIIQMEEQLVNLRVERDAVKKRVSHLETRLMQLQGTLNKTVSDTQAEQSRLKQQLREQEYRLQTTLIANEDLERTVADLQKERQELKRQVSLWPVRLALRLAALMGLGGAPRQKGRSKSYGRKTLP